MRSLKAVGFPLFLVMCFAPLVTAQVSSPQSSGTENGTPATLTQLPAATSPGTPSSFDQVVDRIVEREHFFVAQMRHIDRKSTRLNSSHVRISYAVFCLKKKKKRRA